MITLFHFSDFHSGLDSNIYDKHGIDASNKIVNEINRINLKVDYIVFTGDFAFKEMGFNGAINFFNKLSEKLKLAKDKFLFVPGNHEIAAEPVDEGFDFAKYRTFIHDFYRDEIKSVYGDNFYDRFKNKDFSFDYLINDRILISGFHQENNKNKGINEGFLDSKMNEHAKRYRKNKDLIKIAMIHQAVLPIVKVSNADLLENAGSFTNTLAKNGYRIILTGHSHESEINLLNNQYLNVSVGSFGLKGHPSNYNVIRVDLNLNRITVKSYGAENNLFDDFRLKKERLFEVRAPGIFELTNLNIYQIDLKHLLELADEKGIEDEVLDFLKKNGVSLKFTKFVNSPKINLSYDVLVDLSEMLKKQFDDLILEIRVIERPAETREIPVEIKEIYRGKEGGNEIRMECIRRNIIEDEIINKYVNIYIDNVEFIQKDNKTDAINNTPGKYICIQPASNKHGSVVLPVDKDGNVLLVNQFRHPQRKFITEAIRGFSDFEDNNELITALREFSEEGGGPSLKDLENIGLEDLLLKLTEENKYIHIENEQCAIKDIFYLRNLYTDTGKLWEAPRYYLFHVNHKLQNNNIIRKGPIMESPVWVKFKYVLRSIVQDEAIQLKNNGIEDVFKQNEYSISRRNYLLKYRDPLIDENKIYIEDAFTSQIVFLSLPRLDKFINHQIVEDIFQELVH